MRGCTVRFERRTVTKHCCRKGVEMRVPAGRDVKNVAFG